MGADDDPQAHERQASGDRPDSAFAVEKHQTPFVTFPGLVHWELVLFRLWTPIMCCLKVLDVQLQ